MSDDLSDKQTAHLKQVYALFDSNEDGFVSVKELRSAVKDEIVDEMLETSDIDSNGQINYDEFVRMMSLSIDLNESISHILTIKDTNDNDDAVITHTIRKWKCSKTNLHVTGVIIGVILLTIVVFINIFHKDLQ
eukprot:383986_1